MRACVILVALYIPERVCNEVIVVLPLNKYILFASSVLH